MRIGSILLLQLMFVFSFQSVAATPVVYAWPETLSSDERGDYPVALLKLALEKSGADYRALPSASVMTQHRTLRQVSKAQGIDVLWTMTSPEREQQLRPIRIPIDRGLLGWRLLVIVPDRLHEFEELTSEQLHRLLAIQGSDWPDFPVLQANQFRVLGSGDFEGMFRMVKFGRVDYFPRSVTEIWSELSERESLGLRVAPKWVLHYIAPLYFFVQKDNDELAAAIELGLRAAIEDGSMQALFLRCFGPALDKADLAGRTRIELINPLLPKETPLDNAELWFDPAKGY
ncbi:hypothetical protein [Rheinheimera sp.]|uniref:substrate-binding periplasmic protein n=1 Tax=Rheinheimera sp. TaxID=1869214 RepID=UPI00307F1465